MSQPIESAAAAAAAAPGSSVFTPQPPAAPPPAVAAPPPPEAAKSHAAYREQAYTVMGRHHGIHGRLDALQRRLAELLAGHAALVAHITDQAPAASSSTPGGTAFWGQVLDQHQIIHGMLKAAETEAASLLTAHGGVIGVLESLL
jgi:hypothetical protein